MGEQRRQLRPKCDAGGAGERRHVDDQLGLLLVGEREGIGKHQPSFGIGIADFHGDALARCVDVEWPECVPRDRILNRRDQHAQPHLQLRVHDHVRGGEHIRGAAHVLLHDQHSAVGLDVEPAGVEADPLADQRDLGRGSIAPGQVDQPRCARRSPADRMNQRKVLLEEVIAYDALDRRAVLFGKVSRRLLQFGRPHVVRGRVDEIARERNTLGDARYVRAVDALRNLEPRAIRFRLAVAREFVGAECEGEYGEARVMRSIGEAIGARGHEAGQAARQEAVLAEASPRARSRTAHRIAHRCRPAGAATARPSARISWFRQNAARLPQVARARSSSSRC